MRQGPIDRALEALTSWPWVACHGPQAALDAVTAIRTIESEEDTTPPNLPDGSPDHCCLIRQRGAARRALSVRRAVRQRSYRRSARRSR